jgi:predicted DNA-binding protein with PD1-like motif
MEFTEAKIGRVFVLRLHDGDRLPDIIERFASEHKVSGALCFLVGDVKEGGRVVVGPKNGDVFPPEPMLALLRGVHEVVGVGTIFLNEEGKPKLHMHAGFGRDEKAVAGCIRMGADIWQIGEFIILEIEHAAAKRKKDKKTGFELLEIK